MTTLEAMEKFGGSFVRSLAVCIRCADDENRDRLITAFPELFRRYSQMARDADKKGAS